MKSLIRKTAIPLVIIILVVLFYLVDNIFKIQSIVIQGTPKIEILGIYEASNKNLIFVQLDPLEQKLLELNPGISSITLSKQYPNTLLASYVHRSPAGVLEGADGFFYLSDEGVVIKKERERTSNAYPPIHHIQKFHFNSYKIGSKMNDIEVIFAAQIIPLFQNEGILIKSVDIAHANMIVCNSDEFSIVVSAEKPALVQVEEARFVIDRLAIEGSKFSKLDVRFDKPIITE